MPIPRAGKYQSIHADLIFAALAADASITPTCLRCSGRACPAWGVRNDFECVRTIAVDYVETADAGCAMNGFSSALGP
jgi:hypothetical protein